MDSLHYPIPRWPFKPKNGRGISEKCTSKNAWGIFDQKPPLAKVHSTPSPLKNGWMGCLPKTIRSDPASLFDTFRLKGTFSLGGTCCSTSGATHPPNLIQYVGGLKTTQTAETCGLCFKGFSQDVNISEKIIL